MEKTRIELMDTPMDVIIKMSEGNPGAAVFLMEALKEDRANLIKIILPLDTLEIYGSKIYMLWNDSCSRNVKKVEKVIEAWRTGKLSKERIHQNLNQGRATPFEEIEEKKMTEYICTECKTKQYTSDTKSETPCIKCGGKVEKVKEL